MHVNFSPFMEAIVAHRQAELQHEMELIRLADSVTKDNSSSIQVPAKVFARLGKTFVVLGTFLEQRYGKKSNEGCPCGETP